MVKFLVVKEILEKYESFEQYKKASNSDKAYKLHSAISPELLKLLGRIKKNYNNTYNAEKFIEQRAGVFKYHYHCHRNFLKSGKHFARNSWFEINIDLVKKAFENKEDKKYWNIANDELFSKEAHIWVDKHVFYTVDNYYNKLKPEYKAIFDKNLHNIKEEENNMTKLERIQYQKDYEAGLKAFPLETVLKAEERNKRVNAKRLATRIKKLTQKAMVEEELEIQRLKNKIEQLCAENSRLKTLKDLNSDVPKDVPEDDLPAKLEYEDLDKWFPNGIDDEEPAHRVLMKRFSEDCWKKLNGEFEKEKQMIEENDRNFDCGKELEKLQKALKDFPDDADFAIIPAVSANRRAVKNNIPNDDIPETFDDHREAVAKEIVNAIRDGIVGAAAGKRMLKMIGRENYRLTKIPEQVAGSFATRKNLNFVEKFIKAIAPFEKEFDPAECKWLTRHYRELKAEVA